MSRRNGFRPGIALPIATPTAFRASLNPNALVAIAVSNNDNAVRAIVKGFNKIPFNAVPKLESPLDAPGNALQVVANALPSPATAFSAGAAFDDKPPNNETMPPTPVNKLGTRFTTKFR